LVLPQVLDKTLERSKAQEGIGHIVALIEYYRWYRIYCWSKTLKTVKGLGNDRSFVTSASTLLSPRESTRGENVKRVIPYR
jgi:hypothetical protein